MAALSPGPLPISRVLIADDERIIADTLAVIFQRNGYETLTVYDGDTALLVLTEFRPHLALLDYEMPGTTGLEVAKLLIKMQPHCKVYVLSGYVGFDLPDDGENISGVEYIRKPIMPADLLARLR